MVREGIIEKIAPRTNSLNFIQMKKIGCRRAICHAGEYLCTYPFYGAFSRGLAIPGDPPKNFVQILKKLWWNLDKALDEDGVKYSALVCLVDAIKHGTTTLIDHHASPNAIEGSLDIVADAVNQSGIRASLCYEVTDRDGMDKAEQGMQENLRFIKRIAKHNPADANLRAHFGLHASLTLSAETLNRSRDLCPEDIGFHIHVAEGLADQVDSLEKSGKRVIFRLDEFGILQPKSIFGAWGTFG